MNNSDKFSNRNESRFIEKIEDEIEKDLELDSAEEGIVVNHVMSNSVRSDIFDSIIGYLKRFGGQGVSHVVSERPMEHANVYHYHRANLEKELEHPAVVTIHHDLDDNDRWFRLEKFIGCYQQCSVLVCLNSVQKERLMQLGLSESKMVVIPHGYNAQILAPKKQNKVEGGAKLNIGIVSRRYGRRVKGDAYLFEMAKRLHPDEFKFTLVGKDRTVTAIELRSLGYECEAYDSLPYKMIQSLYDEIDILLMCSLFEGGPANIPEALATKTPIFSTRIGMSVDMVVPGKNGIFLTGSPDEDGALLNTYAENGKQKLSELLAETRAYESAVQPWEAIARSHAELYLSLHQENTDRYKQSEVSYV